MKVTMRFLLAALLAGSFGAHAGFKDKLKSVFGGEQESEEPAELGEGQMADGLREALSKGVKVAIETLGREDGFWGDELVRIPVPDSVAPLAKAARRLGADRYVDDFQQTMNRAAEQAVPAAAEIFSAAIEQMTIEEAAQIVSGPDDAATQYFRRASEPALVERLLPIVRQATESTGVTASYKKLQSKGGGMLGSLIDSEDTDLDRFVTDKALDGLFHHVAEQEKLIREDPLARTSDLLKAVFGR